MRWGSFIARTAVRRVVWILVGLLVYAGLSVVGIARAQEMDFSECFSTDGGNSSVYWCRNEGDARSAGAAHLSAFSVREQCAVELEHQGNHPIYGTYRRLKFRGVQYSFEHCSNPGAGVYVYREYPLGQECPEGQEWNPYTQQCQTPCSSRPTHHGRPPFLPANAGDRGSIPSGTAQCMNGCVYLWSGNADLGFEGMPINQQCSGTLPPCGEGILGDMGYVSSPLGCTPPPPPECKPNEIKNPITGQCGGACPAGMRLNERNECVPEGNNCPAGQTKAPDGSCTNNACPAGQAKGKDGTCKGDGDGNGTPDDEEGPGGENGDGNKFSGGEGCDVPPTCSGDPIMCGQARIQWQIYCKLKDKTSLTGGSCDAMPVCTTGCDALEYSQLIQQWKTACALERGTGSLAIIGGGTGTGDGNGDGTSTEWDVGGFVGGIVDGAAGDGEPCDAFDTPDCGGGNGGGVPGGTGELDDTGLGWGRSCPALPVVSFMGTSINFNDAIGGNLCDWIALGGQILLILAALLSLRILSGGMA